MIRYWRHHPTVVYVRRAWLRDLGSIFVLLFWVFWACVAVVYAAHFWPFVVAAVLLLAIAVVLGKLARR